MEMNSMIGKYGSCIKGTLMLLFMTISPMVTAQKKDSTAVSSFGGAVTIQNKGISTIPNLTLGKPAAIFDLKVGRKLTFEPQFRFSLKGKPWAMVFWWRYNPTISDKFSLSFSANHSLSFKDIDTYTDTVSASSREIIRTTRYVAAAITPNYRINNYLNVSMYWFYTRGIESFITQNTYMVALRPGISNIPVLKGFVARIGPEVYYLKMDDHSGYYFNASLSISKKNFPLSVSALLNKTLKSGIPSEYDFLWNVGLTYTFSNKYKQVQ